MRCPAMVQKTPVRQHLCNYCATQNFNALSYRCTRITSANDRASYGSAISGAPPGSGHTSQYKRVSRYLSGETSHNRAASFKSRSGKSQQQHWECAVVLSKPCKLSGDCSGSGRPTSLSRCGLTSIRLQTEDSISVAHVSGPKCQRARPTTSGRAAPESKTTITFL
jgi:hypothetical protein